MIESARSAGAAVEFSPIGPADHDTRMVAVVDRTAYRIVQESLTNALRHAPAAAVTVRLEHTTDALLIQVADDGPGLRGHPEGRGIAGMRERAAALGGTLTVTDRGVGPSGVVVRARLPVTGNVG